MDRRPLVRHAVQEQLDLLARLAELQRKWCPDMLDDPGLEQQSQHMDVAVGGGLDGPPQDTVGKEPLVLAQVLQRLSVGVPEARPRKCEHPGVDEDEAIA
eukprot:11831326-Alexandrium_andersonii.AAC.1